jgi:hypothetical protein
LLVFTNGRGRDVNLDEVVANLPGFVAARSYGCSEHQRSTAIPCPWAYLTIYELETDDLGAAYAALDANPGLAVLGEQKGETVAWMYSQLTDMLRQAETAPARTVNLGWGEHEFVILTNFTDGRERDFLRWYDAHVPEILENYPGLTTGQLFRAAPTQPRGATLEWEFLALYDLEADDVAEYFEHEPTSLEGMTDPDGALAPRPAQWVFSPIGPRAAKPGVRSGAVTADE